MQGRLVGNAHVMHTDAMLYWRWPWWSVMWLKTTKTISMTQSFITIKNCPYCSIAHFLFVHGFPSKRLTTDVDVSGSFISCLHNLAALT